MCHSSDATPCKRSPLRGMRMAAKTSREIEPRCRFGIIFVLRNEVGACLLALQPGRSHHPWRCQQESTQLS